MSNMQDFVALTSVLNKRIACLFYKQCCASVINHENAIAKKKNKSIPICDVAWIFRAEHKVSLWRDYPRANTFFSGTFCYTSSRVGLCVWELSVLKKKKVRSLFPSIVRVSRIMNLYVLLKTTGDKQWMFMGFFSLPIYCYYYPLRWKCHACSVCDT